MEDEDEAWEGSLIFSSSSGTPPRGSMARTEILYSGGHRLCGARKGVRGGKETLLLSLLELR
jgi:hypothetical protein